MKKPHSIDSLNSLKKSNIQIINKTSQKFSQKDLIEKVLKIDFLLVQHKIYFAPVYELDLVFLKSEEAKKVNLEFRNKKYATDVLSFSYGEKPYGELVFCPDVILKNSKEHDLSYAQELMYMMIHGLLHLHGYDHEKSKKNAKEMFRIQDKIFSDLLKIYGQSI